MYERFQSVLLFTIKSLPQVSSFRWWHFFSLALLLSYCAYKHRWIPQQCIHCQNLDLCAFILFVIFNSIYLFIIMTFLTLNKICALLNILIIRITLQWNFQWKLNMHVMTGTTWRTLLWGKSTFFWCASRSNTWKLLSSREKLQALVSVLFFICSGLITHFSLHHYIWQDYITNGDVL